MLVEQFPKPERRPPRPAKSLRRTPLKPGQPLQRRTALERSGWRRKPGRPLAGQISRTSWQRRRVAIKPGRGRPVKASIIDAVRARDTNEYGLVVCQWPGCEAPAEGEPHHIESRAQYGSKQIAERDALSNQASVCGEHHRRCQYNIDGANDLLKACAAGDELGEDGDKRRRRAQRLNQREGKRGGGEAATRPE